MSQAEEEVIFHRGYEQAQRDAEARAQAIIEMGLGEAELYKLQRVGFNMRIS